MSSFRERFGNLSVGDVLELNAAAKWYCGHEIVADCEGDGL